MRGAFFIFPKAPWRSKSLPSFGAATGVSQYAISRQSAISRYLRAALVTNIHRANTRPGSGSSHSANGLARELMERSTSTEQRKPRHRGRHIALVATTTALMLTYGVVRHLSRASSKLPDQQHFSLYVDRSKAPWERPVIEIREGMPAHINVHSQEAGVLMAHEIPGAFAACASGSDQSLDLFPVGITGRFSLHFHSRTGDQIEVATIEIYPR